VTTKRAGRSPLRSSVAPICRPFECHRGRAVPRLHQRGVVFVECAPILVHQRIAGPCFGDHQHHRVGERIAAHDEQFERIVERRRIRLSFVDQRPELRQIVAQHRRRDRAFARANPVEIAAQRIDFAVVADKAERMREVPRRERVRREALMNHRERRDHRRVVQVDVVLADLVGEQHSLVDDRACRQRRHVELLAVPQVERLDRVAGGLADDVELALERVLVHVPRSAGDEHLADHRLDFLRALRKARIAGRHVAPAEQHLSFRGNRALDLLLARHPRCRLLRQEHHADAVLPDRGQRDAQLAARAAQKGVRQLDQDAGAVALQRIGAGGAAVRQVPQDLQPLRNDLVRLPALDLRDEAEAARVVFVNGVVQTLRGGWIGRFGGVIHAAPRFLADGLFGAKRANVRASPKSGETCPYYARCCIAARIGRASHRRAQCNKSGARVRLCTEMLASWTARALILKKPR